MRTFDSAKVEVMLRPQDVEHLMDRYFSTASNATPAQIIDLALAYADHSRICAMLCRGWMAVLWPFHLAALQVTDIEPQDCLHFGDKPIEELGRRFAVSSTAITHV